MKHMFICCTLLSLFAFNRHNDFPKYIVYSEHNVQRFTWMYKFRFFSTEVLCNCKHKLTFFRIRFVMVANTREKKDAEVDAKEGAVLNSVHNALVFQIR